MPCGERLHLHKGSLADSDRARVSIKTVREEVGSISASGSHHTSSLPLTDIPLTSPTEGVELASRLTATTLYESIGLYSHAPLLIYTERRLTVVHGSTVLNAVWATPTPMCTLVLTMGGFAQGGCNLHLHAVRVVIMAWFGFMMDIHW